MTKRAYYYDRSFEVSDKNRWVEVYVFGDGDVKIEVAEDAGWDSQRAIFTMTAEEATMLKEFLISKGY